MTQKKQKETVMQMITFTLFSISAGVIQVLTFTIMYEWLGIVYWLSYLTALVLSVLWNFTLNRKYTFKSAANVPIAMLKVAGYYVVFTPLSTWWGDALEGIGWNGFIILAGTMVINFVTEFVFTRYVVYHNQINTALKKDKTLDTDLND